MLLWAADFFKLLWNYTDYNWCEVKLVYYFIIFFISIIKKNILLIVLWYRTIPLVFNFVRYLGLRLDRRLTRSYHTEKNGETPTNATNYCDAYSKNAPNYLYSTNDSYTTQYWNPDGSDSGAAPSLLIPPTASKHPV